MNAFDSDALLDISGIPEQAELSSLQMPEKPAGTNLFLSQSSIKQYAGCPYSYFSNHALNVRETKNSDPDASDDGILMHTVFERFLRASIDENGSMCLPQPEDTERIADEIIDEYLHAVYPVEPESMDPALLHQLYRLRQLTVLMLYNIVEEIRTSCFVPSAFEQKIGGRRENSLPEVRLELENGSTVSLGGTVDRVDFYRAPDGKVYFRVIDYKSGEHTFNPDDVKTGLDIQLVLYLFATAKANPDAIPAGANFIALGKTASKSPEINRTGFFLDDKDLLQAADQTGGYTTKLKKQSREEIDDLISQMKTIVCEIGLKIMSGYAAKTPSADACKYCPIAHHCDCAIRTKTYR